MKNYFKRISDKIIAELEMAFAIVSVGESWYVDATVMPAGGVDDFEVLY